MYMDFGVVEYDLNLAKLNLDLESYYLQKCFQPCFIKIGAISAFFLFLDYR